MMHRIVLVGIVALGQGAMLAQQRAPAAAPAAAATVVLRGHVVADEGGRPLRRARIAVTPPDVEQPLFTDDRGAFDVRVPAGSTHTLSVAKAGFVSQSATAVARRSEREPDTALTIGLVRAGVIAGRVLDPLGSPLTNARVRAQRLDLRIERGTAPPAELTAATDDLGEYRLSGLAAGRYVVRVSAAGDSRQLILQGTGQPQQTSPVAAQLGLQGTTDQALVVQAELLQVVAVAAASAPPPPMPLTDQALAPGDVVVEVERGREARVFHDNVERPDRLAVTMDPTGRLVVTPASTAATLSTSVPPDTGVVTGRVVDESGEPVEGLVVALVRIGHAVGERVLESPGNSRATDDRGQFRLFGAKEGSYFLAAVPTGDMGAGPVYAPSYYPGKASLGEAHSIVVEAGRELSGLGITFAPTQIRLVPLRGTVFDASGQPKLVGDVSLSARHPLGMIAFGADTRILPDGSFALPNVPPGDYVLRAVGKGTSGVREFGVTNVTVTTSDDGPVVVATRRGTRLAGRVVFEQPPRSRLSAFGLSMAPADPVYAPMASVYEGGFVGDDGTFEITGLNGPGRIALAAAPEGWWIKSVSIAGRETVDAPILFGTEDLGGVTVVLSFGGARIEGRVTDPGRQVFLNMSVAVFSVNQDHWFYRSRHVRLARAATDGKFGISLPPGEYWVVAIDVPYAETAFGSWTADSLSPLLTRARRITLVEGQKMVMDVGFGRPN